MTAPTPLSLTRAPTPLPGRTQASTGELIGTPTEQITTLVASEVRLAQAEVIQKTKRLGIGAGQFGGAGIVVLLGVGALVTASILGPEDSPDSVAADPDQIKTEIEATRAQLSRTVDELSSRLDVPARAKERAARARITAVETYRENPPLVIGAAITLVGLVVGLVVWRRKRATPRSKR